MRSLIKYISLLVFSGLIIPLYYNSSSYKLSLKQICTRATGIDTRMDDGTKAISFSFYRDVAANIFPIIKNFN